MTGDAVDVESSVYTYTDGNVFYDEKYKVLPAYGTYTSEELLDDELEKVSGLGSFRNTGRGGYADCERDKICTGNCHKY